jgi:hypothetical protein
VRIQNTKSEADTLFTAHKALVRQSVLLDRLLHAHLELLQNFIVLLNFADHFCGDGTAAIASNLMFIMNK